MSLLVDDLLTGRLIKAPMQVKVKKMHPDAKVNSYAKPGDAGIDLTAVEVSYSNDKVIYDTGLAFEIPEGYVGLLFPRSSNSKKDLFLSNAVGVLDSGYRGSVTFVYKFSHDTANKFYGVGERIGQLLILPYPQIELVEAEELTETERGAGSYGSTGV